MGLWLSCETYNLNIGLWLAGLIGTKLTDPDYLACRMSLFRLLNNSALINRSTVTYRAETEREKMVPNYHPNAIRLTFRITQKKKIVKRCAITWRVYITTFTWQFSTIRWHETHSRYLMRTPGFFSSTAWIPILSDTWLVQRAYSH